MYFNVLTHACISLNYVFVNKLQNKTGSHSDEKSASFLRIGSFEQFIANRLKKQFLSLFLPLDHRLYKNSTGHTSGFFFYILVIRAPVEPMQWKDPTLSHEPGHQEVTWQRLQWVWVSCVKVQRLCNFSRITVRCSASNTLNFNQIILQSLFCICFC